MQVIAVKPMSKVKFDSGILQVLSCLYIYLAYPPCTHTHKKRRRRRRRKLCFTLGWFSKLPWFPWLCRNQSLKRLIKTPRLDGKLPWILGSLITLWVYTWRTFLLFYHMILSLLFLVIILLFQVGEFKHLLGVKPMPKKELKYIPVVTHPKTLKLPKQFDARTAWPQCITIGRILG